ncbi:MAG: TonB-dependent receptor [Pseudomonadales bacterium]
MINQYTTPALILSFVLPAMTVVPIATAQDVVSLEEVVVTARRREENLQETPVAITAISGLMIEQSKILNATDLEQYTPNLSVRASDNGVGSSLQAYLRGVGQFDFALTVDPGVGMYVDGVYLARTVGANIQLADIQQIQVLRGPQGTLYGKNTIGGAINVVTRKPSGETDFTAEVIGGEDNYFSFDGYLEFPLSDDVAASVALLARDSDGWQSRNQGDDAGNDNMWSVRSHLNANFTATWNSHLVLDYTDIDQNVYPQVLTDFNAGGGLPPLYNGLVLAAQGQSCCTPNLNDIDSSNALNELDRDVNEIWGISWTNTWDLNDLTLKSITGYRDMNSESYRDADNDPINYFSVGSAFDVQQFSQELLLSNASGSSLDWLLGLYYLEEDGDHFSAVTIGEGLFAALPVAALDLTLDYFRSQKTTSYAAFFNVTWHMNEATRLNLAARYTRDEKDLDMFSFKRASQTPILIPGPTDPSSCSDAVAEGIGSRITCSDNWDEFSPRIGIDHDFSEDIMGYASVSAGFRSGVYNGRPTATAQVSVANPETLWSYEIGLKSQFWNNRLQINGAVFYNDYKDQQFLVNRPSAAGASALALVVDNAADSTLWGGEVEFTVLPMQGLTISGGLAYIEPEYDEFNSLNTVTGELEDLSNREFANVPDWTANLSAQYQFELSNASKLRLRAGLSYKGEIFYTNDEASSSFERLNADSYTIVNAGISYITADDKWEFGVFGRNLADEREIRGGFGVDFFGTTTVSFTEPRRYFASIRYRN